MLQSEFAPHPFQNLPGEECDLTFVVMLEIEEPVTKQAPSGHALDLIHLDDGMFPGRLFVVAKVVMPRRNEQVTDADHTQPPIAVIGRQGV